MKIKKGETVLITSGAYSSYSIHFLAIAKKDADLSELKKEYLEKNPEENEDYKFNSDKFGSFLSVEKDLFEETDYKEIFLGDYGKASECNF